MTLTWYDLTGYAGVVLVLLAFFLLQANKLHGNRLTYQLMNVLGAFGVMLSLVFGAHNWPAFFLEVAWMAIGIYGIARNMQKRHETTAP